MAVTDETRKQLIEYIMLQVYDDQYIDRVEEKKILEIAIKKGMSIEEGLSIIHQIAMEKGLVVEREAESRAKELLEQFARNDGVVDKKEFEDVLGIFKTACKGKVPEPELKRRLKKMVLDNGWKVKEGGLFGTKWFSAIN
jgi:hypothetical protein